MTQYIPGSLVEARGLRWEIVSSHPAGEQSLVRLRCVEGDLRGEELDLLVPFETLTPVTEALQPERAARLEHFRVYHQAFLLEQALGPAALLASQPGRLQIQPYQLVPVMRALRMSRPRLMLADGVGLGKTIQAGLLIAELIARRRAHRVLVVSPAGPLLDQWRREMRDRFGLRFAVLDADRLQEIRFSQELGANPFDHEALGLISIDFAKQERVLQDLERTTYDMVIIDEAHHCMRLGGSGDREDSLRRRLAEVLSRRADALLLLTATPHDGDDAHFASLVELLDPSLVDGRGRLRGGAYRNHLVRRMRRHVKDATTGRELLPERQVMPCAIALGRDTHPQYARFAESLLELVGPLLRRALRAKRYGDVLAFVSLLKRSVSTVAAARATLSTIDDTLAELERAGGTEQDARKERRRTLHETRRRLERFGTLSFDEEQDQARLEAHEMAAELFDSGGDELGEEIARTDAELQRARRRMKQVASTRKRIASLIEDAGLAVDRDPKLARILEEVRAIRCVEARASILIYTEFTDSQDAVVAHLKTHRDIGEVVEISGQDDDRTRSRIAERFVSEDGLILVSTDATAEGLNLHLRCHHLIHVELPYNPNRLEQRNGRIDRFGQTATPMIRYLYLAGTFEERLLARLVRKFENQRKRLTFVPNTLGVLANETDRNTVRLLEGLGEETGALFPGSPEPIAFGVEDEDVTSPAYKELLAEVDRAFEGFARAAKTNDWLSESGLHAEESVSAEARSAREAGRRLGVADLSGFVRDAVRLASPEPDAVRHRPDGTWELTLPNNWADGLPAVPGHEAGSRTVLITDDPEVMHDEDKHEVGFLGRAHPLVRRALDRMLSLRFGAQERSLDVRVSVAIGDGGEPEVLFTYLGRLESRAGAELERIIAVRARRVGEPAVFTEPAAWADLLDARRAAPTRDRWKSGFEAWVPAVQTGAQAAARAAFVAIADAHRAVHAGLLADERRELRLWLTGRALDLCGPVELVEGRLFDAAGGAPVARWRVADDPHVRLVALATDAEVLPSKRRDADLVLRLHDRRVSDLEAHMALSEPALTPLGMLLLLPGARA